MDCFEEGDAVLCSIGHDIRSCAAENWKQVNWAGDDIVVVYRDLQVVEGGLAGHDISVVCEGCSLSLYCAANPNTTLCVVCGRLTRAKGF